MADLPTSQLRLVDLRVHFQDRSSPANHVFPFVDARWRVAFVLLELYSVGLRILWDGLEARPDGLHARASMGDSQLVGAVPLADLAGLVHFDPWWVFKSGPYVAQERLAEYARMTGRSVPPGPDPEWIEAVKASNIAVRFSHEGRWYTVEDVAFDAGLRHLEEVRTRDRWGRPRTFRYGEIELLRLRRPVPLP